MIYNYLLFFLGFYSWNFKSNNYFEKKLQKKKINIKPSIEHKQKKIIKINDENTNSPALSFYLNIVDLKELDTKSKYKIYLYNLYSLFILIFLSIQPMYLFYKMCLGNNFQEYFLIFLMNINTPINYIWAKNYFSTNHFDLFVNNCNYNCLSYVLIIITITLISILISLTNINSFYNEFYYIYSLNKTFGLIVVVTEWIYARFVFTLITSSFTIVFCNHTKEIRKFIKDIITNEFDLEDSYCLSSLIKNISKLRHKVEISIRFYNKLLSFITITGGISLAVFIRHMYMKLEDNNVIIFENHEIYLLQSYILYIICQFIFFYNVFSYSEKRNRLMKMIQSSSFINKFINRWSIGKLKKKCKDQCEIKNLSKMILCIEQENATSIDWMILEKLTSYKWMDFSILGISTQDGSLIKKVITFSSLIYIILTYVN
jgi:hypothetical protein